MSSDLHHDPSPTGLIKRRLAIIKENIKKAAALSGRTENEITLVAVTKTVPVERIRDAIQEGIRDIAENKVQEAMMKWPELKTDVAVRRHLVGSLQTNKSRKAIELFDFIQSVDRPKLADHLNRAAGEAGKVQSCLIEVKVSKEPSKGGIPLNEAEQFVNQFKTYAHLRLKGFMTIGELNVSENETRQAFRELAAYFKSKRDLFGEAPVLSMGMTDDYECAIQEGSTMVRIGRGLFGERV